MCAHTLKRKPTTPVMRMATMIPATVTKIAKRTCLITGCEFLSLPVNVTFEPGLEPLGLLLSRLDDGAPLTSTLVPLFGSMHAVVVRTDGCDFENRESLHIEPPLSELDNRLLVNELHCTRI